MSATSLTKPAPASETGAHHGAQVSLFVPGRICLFGEHSDWVLADSHARSLSLIELKLLQAGGFRRFNEAIPQGMTIVSGINQGIYARASRHPTSLVVSATTSDGERLGPVSIPMRKADLLKAAREGEFFSYMCGVAYRILTDYQVAGIVIDNYMTDLPTKKGLSSSAAICVLTARAFSAVYDLKLIARGEMEIAYQGEILTPSRCGRMDQCCAYGPRPILMRYDGDFLDVDELEIQGGPFHYVLVDLRGTKSTRHILAALQAGYPTPTNPIQEGVHKLLGEINVSIAARAVACLRTGDQRGLGALMTEAQREFDRYAQPSCPSELSMPILHKVLQYDKIQPYILGGKGVGSQGDGTLQLLCTDAAAQKKVVEILDQDFAMPCITFELTAGPQVRVAVIPAAGFSASNYPASRPIQSELFPILDGDGRLKPIVLVNLESLVAAGIEKVVLIVRPDDVNSFERLFHTPLPADHYGRLSAEDQEYARHVLAIGEHVQLVVQDRQEGFGHAVFAAREVVGDQVFLLLLGDHIYSSTASDGSSCVQQMLAAYKRHRCNIVGLKRTAAEDVSRYGAATGVLHRNEPRGMCIPSFVFRMFRSHFACLCFQMTGQAVTARPDCWM